ncbi:MAG TPA: ester cyclase [Nitrososphaera sp.]|nr:ester cyclase [Nitrososphaera sp.]
MKKYYKEPKESSIISTIMKNKALLGQYIAHFNEHNLEKMEELISPRHRFYLHNRQPLDWIGHKELLSSVYYAAFPDFYIEMKEAGMIAGYNLISVPLKCAGTFEGDFQGIPPTGEKVQFSALWIQDFDTNDGEKGNEHSKLAEEWIFFNRVELLDNLKPVRTSRQA